MSDKPSNPNAFPSRSRWDSGNESFDLNAEGMTLRDYFAAKAMPISYLGIDGIDEAAKRAYLFADAMLKAREK